MSDAEICSGGRRVLLRLATALLLAALLSGCSLEARKARYLARGEQYFKGGQYESAKIEYTKLLLADPHNELPFQRLGFIWLEEGAPLRAVVFLLKARELAPNDLSNRLTLARALMSLGRTGEARKEVLAILEQSPAHDDAIVLLADTDQTKEDLDYTNQYLQKLSQPESFSVQLASANVAAQRADFASAAASLERALALDPKSPFPHIGMAKLHVYQKKSAEAEQEFKTAAELAPIRSSIRLRYAEFKIQNGAGNEVKEFLRETTRQAPDYLPAWCLLGQIALAGRQYDEAQRLLENVLSRDPKNPEARILEAQIFLAKGETNKAVEHFEDLERTYKDVPVINYQLARAYLQNKNPAQASVALTHAIAAKPDYLEAILLRSELDLQSGNASLVVPSMITVLKQRPHLRPAELLLTEAFLSLGRFGEAAAVIREQIRVSPTDADACYQLGLVLREQKKFDEAKAAFEKVLELAPGNLMAINQLVDLDIAKKDFNSAMLRVQGELQKKPISGIAYFMEGKTYAAQGRLNEAEVSLVKALELDPGSLGTYQLLISTYLSDNKLDQAINQLQRLLSKDPHQTWALATLASTYARGGDFAKARDTYERLLSENPNSAEVLNKLASLYIDQFNQVSKAYDLATKARTLAPVDTGVADTLGWICYKQGNYQQALELIREAVDKLPGNAETQFHFGMANYMMDKLEAARAAFKKAVASGMDFPHREEAARWLAFLEDDFGAGKQLSKNELKTLLEDRPNDLVARSHLAALFEREGAMAEAAAQYEAALNINPRLLDATLKLAQLYAGPLHNFSRAFELAKTARDLDRGDPRTARILGKIAYQTSNFSWAYDLLVESAHGLRQDGTIVYDLAWAAYSLGKVAEARKTMEHALELGIDQNHSFEAKRFLMFTALEQKGEPITESDTEIEQLLKADPNYVPALMLKAAIEMQRGQSEKAVGTYSEVLRQFPDFAPAQKQLAALYMDDPSTAIKAYELAIKARNTLQNDSKLAQMLGEMSYRRNDYDYALQLLQESAKAQPLDAKGLYYLGMSHFRMRQQAQGQSALERSLAAGLQEPFASEAKRVLADLNKGKG